MEKSVAAALLQGPRLKAGCWVDAFNLAARVQEAGIERAVSQNVLRVGQVNAEEAIGAASIEEQVYIAVFLHCCIVGYVM